MRLALALGWRSVEEMLGNMDFAELVDWMNFFSIEPFPEDRADLRSAHLLSLIANMVSKRPISPKEFLPDYWGDVTNQIKEPDSAFILYHKAQAINAALGGKVIKRSEILQ